MAFLTGLIYVERSDGSRCASTDTNGNYPPTVLRVGEGLTAASTIEGAVNVITITANPTESNSGFEVIGVRNVVTENVANLSQFNTGTTSPNDMVANVAGDAVLLVGQSSADQNGPYTVGTVDVEGYASLTRLTSWSGTKTPESSEFRVRHGQKYAGTVWRSFKGASFLIGTDDPVLYPESFRTSLTLVSGTGESSGLWIFGESYVGDVPSVVTCGLYPSGSVESTYRHTVAAVTPGAGTGSVMFGAYTSSGEINSLDESTLSLEVHNWDMR